MPAFRFSQTWVVVPGPAVTQPSLMLSCRFSSLLSLLPPEWLKDCIICFSIFPWAGRYWYQCQHKRINSQKPEPWLPKTTRDTLVPRASLSRARGTVDLEWVTRIDWQCWSSCTKRQGMLGPSWVIELPNSTITWSRQIDDHGERNQLFCISTVNQYLRGGSPEADPEMRVHGQWLKEEWLPGEAGEGDRGSRTGQEFNKEQTWQRLVAWLLPRPTWAQVQKVTS